MSMFCCKVYNPAQCTAGIYHEGTGRDLSVPFIPWPINSSSSGQFSMILL